LNSLVAFHKLNRMEFARSTIVTCLAFFAVVYSLWGGPYVLRPMDLAAKAKVAPVQFTILDFLSLTAYLAVPLAFVAGISKVGPGERAAAEFIMWGGGLIAVLIWWGSVRTAAKAGIRHTGKRLLMVGVVVPLTYPMSLISGFVIAGLLVEHFAGGKTAPAWVYIVITAWLAYFFIARRVVVWILSADAEKPQASDPWSEPDSTANPSEI
jgi:hypothetical protein